MERSELFQYLLLQNRADVCRRSKVGFSSRVAALTAHVDQIGKRLSTCGPFMEIGPFPSECVRGDHTLGFELVVAHGTTKLDLTQRCHSRSLPRYGTSRKKREGISVPQFSISFGRDRPCWDFGSIVSSRIAKTRQAPYPRTGR